MVQLRSLASTSLILLIALPALVLQSGSSARADQGPKPACPRVANRGEITASKTGEMVPGDVHWYSWKVSSGDHQVWVQGADDFDIVLCINGVSKSWPSCSKNYGPVGDGCLFDPEGKGNSSHPGIGEAVKGPANALIGVTLCRSGCIRSPLGSTPSPYTLAVR